MKTFFTFFFAVGIFFSLFLASIAPRIKFDMARLQKLQSKDIARRGYHENKKVAENSMQAFKLAVQNDMGIELDVLITKDGQIVVLHDDNLTRLTGKNVKITASNYVDIANLTLLGTHEKIPRLEEVLQVVPPTTPLLIEIKT